MVEVFDVELAIFTPNFDLLRSQYPAIMITEDWNQHLVSKLFFERLPIDVEIVGISAGRSIFKNVPPQFVIAAGDGHVIRHDVQNLAQVAFAKSLTKFRVFVLTAELCIHAVMIDDIIAVLTSGRSLKIW